MQKNNIMLFAGMVATGCILSCNMQMPETVSVKTDARFEVPLGTAKYDVTESLSSETIITKVQDAMGDKATLYDFIPSGDDADVLTYLIHYPAYSVPIDIGKYLEGLDLKEKLNDSKNNLGEAFSFEAGKPITQSVTKNISLGDVGTKINDSMQINSDDATVKIENLPEMTGDSDTNATLKGYLPTITIKNSSETITYDRVFYSNGEIELTVTRTDTNTVSSGYDITVLGELVDTSGKHLSYTNDGAYTSITNGATLHLPLTASEGLPSEFKVQFKVKATGTGSATQHTFAIASELKNTKLSKITGLTATAADLGISDQTISETIPLGDNVKGFKSATFSNAPVAITAEGPSGWTGVDCTIDPFTLGGVVTNATITPVESSNDTSKLIDKSYSLSGNLDPSRNGGAIAADATIAFALKNATITFQDGKSDQAIAVRIAVSLTTVDEAVVDLNELLGADKTTFSLDSVELPEALLTYVNSISFAEDATDAEGNATGAKRNGFGLKTKVTNSLPSEVKIRLEAFKLGRTSLADGTYFSADATLKGGVKDEELTIKDTFTVSFADVPEGTTNLDFTATLVDAENTTLKNITLGESYSFGLAVEDVILDWDSVSLKLSGVDPVTGDVDLPFDLGSLMEGFDFGDKLDKIQIETLPVYFYAQRPDEATSIGKLFKDITFNAAMYASYKNGETQTYLDLVSDESEASTTVPTGSKEIAFVNPVSWPEKGTQITEASFKAVQKGSYSFMHDLKDILNNRNATDMKLAYTVTLSNGTDVLVRKSMLEGETNVDLAIDMAALLKFKLGLTAPVTINLMELADEEYNKKDENGDYSDLLSRDKDDDALEKYADYADSIKELGVKYRINNELLPNLQLAVTITDEKSGLNETLSFGTGQQTLTFDGNTIKHVMTTWPFHPQVEITLGEALPQGKDAYDKAQSLAISRSGLANKDALSANIILFIQADEDSPIKLYPQD